jgi:hypothetical protein
MPQAITPHDSKCRITGGNSIVSLVLLVLCFLIQTLPLAPSTARSEVTAVSKEAPPAHAEKRSGQRIQTLWNPTFGDIQDLTKESATLEVLQIAAMEFVGEQAKLPDEVFEVLPRMGRLRTVIVSSHLPLKPEHIAILSRVRSLKALVLYLNKDGTPDHELLKSLKPNEHLEILGVYEGDFSPEFWDEFRKTHPKLQVELYNGRSYGDVFDANGCINGRFQRKYWPNPDRTHSI